jgi:hypothetical protein
MIETIKAKTSKPVKYCAYNSGKSWGICESVIEAGYAQTDTEYKRYFDTLQEAEGFLKSLEPITRINKVCDWCGTSYVGYVGFGDEADVCDDCWEAAGIDEVEADEAETVRLAA